MLGGRPRLCIKSARVRYLAAKACQRACFCSHMCAQMLCWCQDLVYEASVHLAALSAVSDSEGDGAA